MMEAIAERRSISGIRGTAETLDGFKVIRYAKAFGTFLRGVTQGNTIVVGMDTRPTSANYKGCVLEGLRATGWDVIDLDVVPTPTVQVAIQCLGAAGGVVITASHNPVEYNGVKFLQNRDGLGMFLTKEQVQAFFSVYDNEQFDERRAGEVHPVADLADEFNIPPYVAEYVKRHALDLPLHNAVILDYHLHRVLSAMGSELDRIRGMNFRVAMDCCGGAGIPLNYVLLDHLYCRIKPVNNRPGVFTRPIEPAPRNLAALCRELQVDTEPYAVCFVTDCDNDRCVLIARDSATGEYRPLEEDYTFALSVDHVLSGSPRGSTVVTNWSTSQMLDDVAMAHHANLRRAPTGEVYTATEAYHFGAVIAGEGSCAGVIDPRVGMGRDVLVAIWHILGTLTQKQRDLNDIAQEMPVYYKINRDHRSDQSIEDTAGKLDKLQCRYAEKKNIHFINREDGLIVVLSDRSRIQIRSSNTEPILRIRSEAPDKENAESLVAEALQMMDCLR